MTDEHDVEFPVGGPGGFPDELSVSPSDDRYVLKIGDITNDDRERVTAAGLEIIHDLEHVGYLVVRGEQEAVEETGYEFITDFQIQR